MSCFDLKVQDKPIKKTVFVSAVAMIDVDGRILVAKRPEGKHLAGMWEFPGGKIEQGESFENGLIRELKEELGIDTKLSCLAPITFMTYHFDEFYLMMPLYACRVWDGIPIGKEGQELAWLDINELNDENHKMPDSNIPLIPILRELI